MNILKSLRKIRACEGDTAAQLVLEELIDKARREERKKMWDQINSHIKTGDLGGNGCDKNAERNGLVLAANVIFQFGI